jgi:hypothetical protein
LNRTCSGRSRTTFVFIVQYNIAFRLQILVMYEKYLSSSLIPACLDEATRGEAGGGGVGGARVNQSSSHILIKLLIKQLDRFPF